MRFHDALISENAINHARSRPRRRSLPTLKRGNPAGWVTRVAPLFLQGPQPLRHRGDGIVDVPLVGRQQLSEPLSLFLIVNYRLCHTLTFGGATNHLNACSLRCAPAILYHEASSVTCGACRSQHRRRRATLGPIARQRPNHLRRGSPSSRQQPSDLLQQARQVEARDQICRH